MSPRTIRSGVARTVVITGLAASLFAGAVGLAQPREASAFPNMMSCTLGHAYLQMSRDAYIQGNPALGAHYYEVGMGYLQDC
jgi:hypothetical protein